MRLTPPGIARADEEQVQTAMAIGKGSWGISHRHADPLTDRHSLGDILTFAYGQG